MVVEYHRSRTGNSRHVSYWGHVYGVSPTSERIINSSVGETHRNTTLLETLTSGLFQRGMSTIGSVVRWTVGRGKADVGRGIIIEENLAERLTFWGEEARNRAIFVRSEFVCKWAARCARVGVELGTVVAKMGEQNLLSA